MFHLARNNISITCSNSFSTQKPGILRPDYRKCMAGVPERVKRIMQREGLTKVNQPKRTPNHPTKKGVVMAFEDGEYKLVRFGDQKMTTAGKASKNEPASDTARRASFRARHRENIARGKTSGAYWAARELW